MATDNFERCLAVTLQWEGGYSNHPDDPGGPTMRGVIQREYDAYRKRKGKSRRPVENIEEGELLEIYRTGYWDPMDCEGLAQGLDLCVFDAAVNSGPVRASRWLADSGDIDGFCDHRLAFLKQTGRLWRVFGQGWSRRVSGIRAEAHRMSGKEAPAPAEDGTLHAGMKGQAVAKLQRALRGLGYPSGAIDGIYGEQTYRAVLLFQQDQELQGEPGIWQPDYRSALESAEAMLPKRKAATHRDLEAAGDVPVKRMNLLQRIFAWAFGASAAAQIFDGSSVIGAMSGARSAIEPIQDLLSWTAGHRWLLIAILCAGLIALIRLLRSDHVRAYRHFDYQGPFNKEAQ